MRNTHKLVRAICLFGLAGTANLIHAEEANVPEINGQLRTEIRTILDAGNGQVRKWIEPHKVVVVCCNNHVPDFVNDVFATIAEGGINFFSSGQIQPIALKIIVRPDISAGKCNCPSNS